MLPNWDKQTWTIVIIGAVLLIGLAMVLGRDFQPFYDFITKLFS